MNFKKLTGAVINESTFNFVKVYDAPVTWVSKIVYNTVNICFDAPQAEAGTSVIHIMPEVFTKEVNLQSSDRELSEISIKALPDKTVYNIGDTFDETGMIVEAEYSDDTTAVITDYTCYPTDLDNDNIQSIVVSYAESGVIKSAEFDIVLRKQPVVLAGDGRIHATMANANAGGASIENGSINCNIPGFVQNAFIDYTPGTEMTLTAGAVEGMSFLYWKNAHSDRIVSRSQKFTFKVGSNTQLTAVYKEIESGQYLVEFVDKNGKVLQSDYLSDTDKIVIPEPDPYSVGYKFTGWSPTVTEYANKDETFYAQYAVEGNLYQVELNGPAIFETGEGSNSYNSEVKVTVNSEAIPDGQRFLCWKRDGKVVGYESEYSFYVWDDTAIYAVCGSNSAEIDKTPQIMMDKVKISGGRVIFMSERIVPDGYEYIESGILLSEGSGTEDILRLEGGDYDIKAVAQNSDKNGQFAVRKDNISGDWYARVYIIYKDGSEIKVAYSKIAYGFAEKP